jgi:hypothetical protein
MARNAETLSAFLATAKVFTHLFAHEGLGMPKLKNKLQYRVYITAVVVVVSSR